MAEVYPDSKTFVDMKMKYGRNETIRRFNLLMDSTAQKPTKHDLLEFLNNTFEEAGSEFETWQPLDWIENPPFIEKIKDKDLKDWALKLNGMWKMLGRQMKPHVGQTPDLYSIIYVPNPVIIPGGRFREFYYWDSYWIVRGLLLSKMHKTVRGMLSNFVGIVDKYGFVPNGGRVYYTRRSQPPLLIPMVESYLEATGDYGFIKDNIHTLEKEYDFWINNRSVSVKKSGKTYRLALYSENSKGPRPESYKEDFRSAWALPDEDARNEFYSELKSAAESGWDFSSRWFVNNGTNKGNITHIKIKQLVPVDLNSILCWNARLLADFYEKLNMTHKADQFRRQQREWTEAVEKVLWDERTGAWLDWDTVAGQRRPYFAASSMFPLWTGCYDKTKMSHFVGRALKYLERADVTENPGGVPTTLELSGEQWDFPNAWPPLQHVFVVGLDSTDDLWAKRTAFEIAERWVRSNFKVFNETGAMYEKYDASKFGGHGGGGEYEVQLGFGWSNGVILDFLDMYGRDATSGGVRTAKVYPSPATATQVIAILLGFLGTLAVGCIGLMVYNRRTLNLAMKSGQKPKVYPKLRYSKIPLGVHKSDL
ncbi:hypothetical protein AAG570_009408 [Ranatra chinensis]|uniref:Trehalase n=1 Tax=Ranatra chinensis TaxID=642074 RepID=A0ABD0YZV7_9HEMI